MAQQLADQGRAGARQARDIDNPFVDAIGVRGQGFIFS